MANPEVPFSLPSDAETVLEIATKFTGENYRYYRDGLTNATNALLVQHKKIMPPFYTGLQIRELITQQDSIFEISKQMATQALEKNDYENALSAANHLYVYGDVDYKDSLGGKLLNLSLTVHRALAENIRTRFANRDSFLRVVGIRVFAEIEKRNREGNYQRELELLRQVIHMTALNGTLGEDAERQFDPFAIVKINNPLS